MSMPPENSLDSFLDFFNGRRGRVVSMHNGHTNTWRRVLGLGAVILAAIIFIVAIALRFGFWNGPAGNGLAMVGNAWNSIFSSNNSEYSDDFDASSTSGTAYDDFLEPAAKKSVASPPVVSPIVVATNSQPVSRAVPVSSCVFPPALPSSTSPLSTSKLMVINEIAWMGSPIQADDEWIELKNNSTNSIELAGWRLMDRAGAITVLFNGDDRVPAQGFFLLARGTTSMIAEQAAVHYTGTLANTGDALALLDPQCNVIDAIDAGSGWPGGNNTTKQTLERTRDGLAWQTSVPIGGTPGAENSVQVPTSTVPASSSIVSSTNSGASPNGSVSPQSGGSGSGSGSNGSGDDGSGSNGSALNNDANNATSSDANNASNATTTTNNTTSNTTSTASGNGTSTSTGAFCAANHIVIAQIATGGAAASNDFIKLYNPGIASVSLDGWRLRKKTSGGTDSSIKVFGAGNSIVPGGFFVWANTANGFAASLNADASSSATLAADNSVALMDASGTIIDEVAWGTGTNQYEEGHSFPTNPQPNQILERISVNGVMGDLDDNALDFALH